MATNFGKLSRKQEIAIAALLESSTIAAAAEVSRTAVRTLHRWLTLDHFQSAYAAARRQVVRQALAKAQAAMARAVDALLGVVDDVDAPVSCRISAAKEILGVGLKGLEIQDIQARIENIESRLYKGGHR